MFEILKCITIWLSGYVKLTRLNISVFTNSLLTKSRFSYTFYRYLKHPSSCNSIPIKIPKHYRISNPTSFKPLTLCQAVSQASPNKSFLDSRCKNKAYFLSDTTAKDRRGWQPVTWHLAKDLKERPPTNLELLLCSCIR